MRCKILFLNILFVISGILIFLVLLEAQDSPAGQLPKDNPKQSTDFTKKHEKQDAFNLLRIGMYAADKGTLDPHFAAADVDRAVADMVFNGLIRYKPGNAPEIEADLVQSIPEPKVVDGKQVWTFSIREGVMFHPGPKTEAYELTADDVVYSLKKSADPARSAYAGEYTGMTVEKVDKYTVRINLDKPLSTVLFLPKVSNVRLGFCMY